VKTFAVARMAVAWTVTAVFTTANALAADYPVKPIRWIVVSPPGSPPDVIGRMIGARMTDAWGQQVVLDFRPGGGMVIGSELAAKAAPDGYTLLFGQVSALAINPTLMGKIPYDPFRDFAPISLLAIGAHILVVNGGVPVNSVKDLIALAKAKPGQLNYASSGPGTSNHLGMELLKALTGTDMVHVPYKGSTGAITDLIGGQIQLMLGLMPSLIPHVKTAKLKALAVSGAQRSALVPDIPTMAEAGVAGFGYVVWFGMLAPAHTPRAIVNKLNAQVVQILREPEIAKRLESHGMEPRGSTPDELTQLMREDTARWKNVIATAHIRID
jgi:tripartite-type tricarboxylate transporter receptor subunit TctC